VIIPRNDSIVDDYRLAYISRQMSLLGSREVMAGRAKFGIFGDGKEVAQVALAKTLQKGDWRSGYYRDQTWMLAMQSLTIEQFFAQLYADFDPKRDPHSSGRQMICHFATSNITKEGVWVDQSRQFNTAADMSANASQMPRSVGLAYASKLYRRGADFPNKHLFTNGGEEVCIATIGNGACAEGLFWETINAMTLLQIPLVVCVWDDEYAISVPNCLQLTKSSISSILEGFVGERGVGLKCYRCPGWDYLQLCRSFQEGIHLARRFHQPVVFHIHDLTQPLGHSTSGSHERYKNSQRLQFEKEFDCLTKMRLWLLEENICSEDNIKTKEKIWKQSVKNGQEKAWAHLQNDLMKEMRQFQEVSLEPTNATDLLTSGMTRRSWLKTLHKSIRQKPSSFLVNSYKKKRQRLAKAYGEYLYPANAFPEIDRPPIYKKDSVVLPGYEILRRNFQQLFSKDSRILAIGEDIGVLGGVNQVFRGLQKQFGSARVTDTGIREATILGQGIGLALRGFRPIVDIQYLDYLVYALEGLTDDLSSLSYRTGGQQCAPVIVRTKGHRLEGIWHAGSPLSMLLGSLRGMAICVPRNMTQAAGLYNYLFQANIPSLMIECLNAYRLKERLPENFADVVIPIGYAEIIRTGCDITVVTYGACVSPVLQAASECKKHGISLEVVDVQCLLPCDRKNLIRKSLEKTNALMIVDEDVPGGASAFLLDLILCEQKGYELLDLSPKIITAAEHRTPYGDDGDFFAKPQMEDVFNVAYELIEERKL